MLDVTREMLLSGAYISLNIDCSAEVTAYSQSTTHLNVTV